MRNSPRTFRFCGFVTAVIAAIVVLRSQHQTRWTTMMYGKTGGKGGYMAPGGKGGGGMVIPPRQGFASKGAVAVASPSPSPAIANKGSPKGGGKAGSNWGGCGVWNPMFNAMMMLGPVRMSW